MAIIAVIVLFVLLPQTTVFAEGETVKLFLTGGTLDGYSSDEQGAVTLAVSDELTLPIPTKTGYSFDGWTKSENADDVDYVLTVNAETVVDYPTLYARFSLLKPTFVVEPDNVTAVYDENTAHTLSVEIAHDLLSTASVSYAWYKNGGLIEVAQSNTLTLKTVADSGEYFCRVTFAVNGETTVTDSRSAVVDIQKATVTDIPNVIIEGTYDSQKTLADYTLPEYFAWVNADICPDVQTRTYEAIFDKGENYGRQETLVTLILQKAKQVVNVENLSVVYDGESHSIVASATAGNILYSDNNSLTNVGKETIIVTAEETDNYLSATAFAILEVTAQPVRVVWGELEFVYDGESHVPDYSCVSAQNVALTLVIDGANVNAGEYTATASIQDDNYTLTNDTTNYTIQKQSVEVVWGELEFVYDGENHVPDYSCVSAQNVALTLIIDGANVNAGEYTATASIQNDNFALTDNSINYVIHKATVDETTIIFEDKTVVYDGNAYSITASNIPDFLSVEYSGEFDAPGIYTITAHFSLLDNNYNEVGDKQATLTILQNRFESDWYQIICPKGIDPTVNATLQTIDDLDGITNKENSKINCIYGFRVVFDRPFDYAETMIIRIKLDKVDLDTLVLAVDNELNEQIITYSYQNGSIEIAVSDYSTNYVIGKRTRSIWWIIPLCLGICVLTCLATVVITKYSATNKDKKKQN